MLCFEGFAVVIAWPSEGSAKETKQTRIAMVNAGLMNSVFLRQRGAASSHRI